MLRVFFYLLFATILVSVNAVSAAEPAPGLQLNFRSAAAAKTWFARQYSHHEIHETKLQGGLTVYAMYGTHGSGVIQVDASFIACEQSSCKLIGFKGFTKAAQMVERAKISVENSVLTIESTNNFRFVYSLLP